MLEKISAVTLRVASLLTSVRLYRDLLGLGVIYGGEDSYFSSLRTKNGTDPILNLEQGKPASQWGRLIFYVSDVDSSWAYLNEGGLRPELPRDALWGERYSHIIWPIQMATSCRLLAR
jgi:catechol 2,3-dioxygenase-like lactoylglutathione lyase family enzyme